MTSESRPRTSSTAARRRCSWSNVPDSLKSGTTIERSKPCWLLCLRGMAKAPCDRMCEVMTNQLDLLLDEEVVTVARAQQLRFLGPRRQQSRAGPRERIV